MNQFQAVLSSDRHRLPMAGPVSGSDESDLVAGLRKGEGWAFDLLVKKHGPRLLAVARRLVRDEEDARDVVQEALLCAFRSLNAFKAEARISTWLHRIVVNSALMRLRTRRRKPEEPIEPLLPTFSDDGHHHPRVSNWQLPQDRQIERDETRRLVRSCISRLPESYRTILILRDIEELDTSEAARFLEISVAAAKIRLHRARQALRTLLAPYYSSGETA